ncbi:MAG: hydantoinase/oxoprolinase family protein [Desulfatiglandaceae bacterium]
MILGLDVGGTQTDSVLIEGGRIIAECKVPTGGDLLETLGNSLTRTLDGVKPEAVERMVFSTTMATNAIVQDRMDPAGVIVSAGPGIDPALHEVGPCYRVVPGCIDHQGFEVQKLDRSMVAGAASDIKSRGIDSLAAVGKFSVRNPVHEEQIRNCTDGHFRHVAMGHHISGSLNFPRRIATAYLNAALSAIHHRFIDALSETFSEMHLEAPSYLLKPDGGTCRPDSGPALPSRTAQSGPAASVMGALALDGCEGTTLVLDIGGTTTDMSVVLDGVPLLDPKGIALGPYLTLIRSLIPHSAGIGGDSSIRLQQDGTLSIGPDRIGAPVAFGGRVPTPTDAMIAMGLLEAGDRGAALDAMGMIGGTLGCGRGEASRFVLESTARRIADEVRGFLEMLNSRPVYTIHEVLHDRPIIPSRVVIIGGPAAQLAPFVASALGLDYSVPAHYEVANAVGAAVARVTAMVTLQADTERGTVIIPEAGINRPISMQFDIHEAEALAEEALRSAAASAGGEAVEISVVERQCFNMIRGYSRTGRNIRLKLCVTPGLTAEWSRGK